MRRNGGRGVDIDTMIQVLAEFYEHTPPHLIEQGLLNDCGGYLHIVTDDGNLDDCYVRFCMDKARKGGDRQAVLIAEELLRWTMEEREGLYERYQEYGG